MLKVIPLRETGWLLPFAILALASLALLRPAPPTPKPAHDVRIVVDADGLEVPIEIPFRGVAFTWCGGGAGGYLGVTHSPRTIVNAGSARDRESFRRTLLGWIFPDVVARDSLWDGKVYDAHGGLKSHYAELESLMAYNAGAYLGACGAFGLVPALRRVGLPVLATMSRAPNWDENLFMAARIEAALAGEPECAEALIAGNRRAYAALDKDLQTGSLKELPSILIMGSKTGDWREIYVKNKPNDYRIYLPPAGVVNAAGEHVNQAQHPDTERLLLIDPDMIFLMGHAQTPQEFKRDPRWRGLKAVAANRVYRMPGAPDGGGGLMGLHFQPLSVRWMAELAHPDRLQPKLREVMRAHYETEFGYRLSDEQMDQMLHIDVNKNSEGYARFLKRQEGASQ